MAPRVRIPVLMRQIVALNQGLKGLALRRKEAFTQELHREVLLRQSSLIEVVKWTTSKLQREVWAAAGLLEGVCPTGAALQHGSDAVGNGLDVYLELVSHTILMALSEEYHRVNCEDFVEFQDRHVPESPSWLVERDWEFGTEWTTAWRRTRRP